MKKVQLIMMVLFALVTTISFGQNNNATYEEVITKKKKGKLESYTTKNGETFNIGDTLILGVAFRNEQFDYIQQNAGIATYPLPNSASGSLIVIKSIRAISKTIQIKTTSPQGFVYPLWVINFEGAINNGEINSGIMTSDEALSQLKKEKDKLDLGLITQE